MFFKSISFTAISITIAAVAPLFAEATPKPQSPIAGFMPLILIFLIFYFLLIRPQQKQAKEHQKMLTALKKGDKVITSGGLIGEIVAIDNNVLTLLVDTNCRVKFTKSSVSSLKADTALKLKNNNKK